MGWNRRWPQVSRPVHVIGVLLIALIIGGGLGLSRQPYERLVSEASAAPLHGASKEDANVAQLWPMVEVRGQNPYRYVYTKVPLLWEYPQVQHYFYDGEPAPYDMYQVMGIGPWLVNVYWAANQRQPVIDITEREGWAPDGARGEEAARTIPDLDLRGSNPWRYTHIVVNRIHDYPQIYTYYTSGEQGGAFMTSLTGAGQWLIDIFWEPGATTPYIEVHQRPATP